MGFVRVSVRFVLGFMWSRFGISGCLVWVSLTYCFVRVCFGVDLGFVLALVWGLLRVGLGFIQGRFRVYLGLV